MLTPEEQVELMKSMRNFAEEPETVHFVMRVEDVRAIVGQIENLTDALAKHSQMLSDARTALQALHAAMTQRTDELAALRADFDQVSKQRDDLHSTANTFREREKNAEKRLHEVQRREAELTNRVASLQEDLSSRNLGYDLKKIEITANGQKIEGFKDATFVEAKPNEVYALNMQLGELQSKYDHAVKRHQSMLDESNESSEKIDSLTRRLNRARARSMKWHSRYLGLRSEELEAES